MQVRTNNQIVDISAPLMHKLVLDQKNYANYLDETSPSHVLFFKQVMTQQKNMFKVNEVRELCEQHFKSQGHKAQTVY